MEHSMRAICLAKVIVHINVGESGDKLEKARKVLSEITGQKPSARRAKRTIKDFGIREGEPIACLTTLRGERAESFLKRAFDAIGNRLRESSFDDEGNFSFGIREHIEIPNTKYNPELGIFGMDVTGSLERPGYRIKRRRIMPKKIGKHHRVTKKEALSFVAERFKVKVGEA